MKFLIFSCFLLRYYCKSEVSILSLHLHSKAAKSTVKIYPTILVEPFFLQTDKVSANFFLD